MNALKELDEILKKDKLNILKRTVSTVEEFQDLPLEEVQILLKNDKKDGLIVPIIKEVFFKSLEVFSVKYLEFDVLYGTATVYRFSQSVITQ